MIATSSASTQASKTSLWQPATWPEYERQRDESETGDRRRLYFHDGYLRVDNRAWEGTDHSEVRELFVFIFAFWFMQHPDRKADSLSNCLIQKTGCQAITEGISFSIGMLHKPEGKNKDKKFTDF